MLPEEHRARHVHVCRVVAVEQVLDAVREVQVAGDDADVQLDARPFDELGGVAPDARDVRVGVGAEEADAGHRSDGGRSRVRATRV
jgi:hypothetical protein